MNLNEKVLYLNRKIKKEGLVSLTWGNVSCLSADRTKVFIKPSGIKLELAVPEDMSIIDLKTGKHLGGKKQSVDTNIHLEIYRSFSDVNCVVHTHSKFATILAQSKIPVVCTGTTHADYFDGTIPVVNELSDKEIQSEYEKNLGKKIVEYFESNKINHKRVNAALLPLHGPMVWGTDYDKTIESAIVLEKVSEMFYYQMLLNSKIDFNSVLLRKHYDRKHGVDKYYGQN